MRCTNCDHLNPADARFCTSCGATFAATVPLQAQPVAPIGLAAPLAAAPVAPLATTAAAVPGLNQTINVTVQAPVAAPAPTPVVVLAQQAAGPGCLVRALYFCFVGLWLGALWTGLAWFLLVTVIGLPLGLMMLNRIPQVMTLKPVRTQTQVTTSGGVVVVSQGQVTQQPFWLRAVYFVVVGWWLSGLWLGFAWGLIGATFGLGLPLAFWMFDRTPAIVTLARQ
ncbi:MAG TPA: zinc ribbon domain-containing protein [Chloroflexaceae bacterium]|nr:zinc ribbon domain-containing protein [Chloroflexaceae bacterium]